MGTDDLYHNARIFTSPSAHDEVDATTFAECMLVRDGRIVGIGTQTDVEKRLGSDAQVTRHTLDGKLVVPGFVDGHAHVTLFGASLDQVELIECETVADIQAALRGAIAQRGTAERRVVCKNWKQTSTGYGVTAADLDAVESQRPVYVTASSLHATWLNTAALHELGITDDTPDPDGGKIYRDASTGKANGILDENAHFKIVWPGLAALLSEGEREADAMRAFDEYTANGYTGTVDMAMDEAMLDTFRRIKRKRNGTLPIRVSAYWFILPEPDIELSLDRVRRAAVLMHEECDEWLRVVGVKVMVDGIVDVCTAALKKPYADAAVGCGEPIWPLDRLTQVVQLADSLGLQVAMHAIGDEAVHIAVQAVASLNADASHDKRHRIEHLEISDPADLARLAPLGITASVQPIHADPAHLDGYMAKLGNDERCGRMFAYRDMAQQGAHMAIGTDTPTAQHSALSNLYSAVLRRSVHAPESTAVFHDEWALPLASSLVAATSGAAFSVKAEKWCGSLAVGKSADFAVLDFDPFSTAEEDGHGLLRGSVQATYIAGKKVYERK